MKSIKFIIVVVCLSFCHHSGHAQTLNFNSLENTKHIMHIGAGWDYGLSYSAGYACKIDARKPLFVNANLSVPSGGKILDDFKLKIGSQLVVLDKESLKGTVAVNGIFRRYENPMVRLVNFGAEIKGTIGYYKPKWFIAGEAGFDKAISTHFKHSEIFRETVYADVADGWFKPATGGNFYYGLQTGYSLKKCDFTFNIGRVLTQDFKTAPLIPYYLMIGFNHRLP